MEEVRSEIPNPLRNVTTDEICAALDNISIEVPDGIDSADWGDVIDKVRAAVQLMRLDIPIGVERKIFLPSVCDTVDYKVRRNVKVDQGLLRNPLVNIIREQIGLYITVRVRLGRSQQFADLIRGIKEHNGDISLTQLETDYGCHSVTNTMRLIVKSVGDGPEKKESVWLIIQEFLAEQAGITEVNFSRRSPRVVPVRIARTPDEFIAERAARSRRRELESLGIVLEFSPRVSAFVRSVSEARVCMITALDDFVRTVVVALLKIVTLIKKFNFDRVVLNREIEALKGILAPYFTRKKVFDDAAKKILGLLPGNLTELPREYARLYINKIRQLEAEFAEPLSDLRAKEAALSEIALQESSFLDVQQQLLKEWEELLELGAKFGGDVAEVSASTELSEELSFDRVDRDRKQYLKKRDGFKTKLNDAIYDIDLSIIEIAEMITKFEDGDTTDVNIPEKIRLLKDELEYLEGEKAKFEELLGIIDPSSVVP